MTREKILKDNFFYEYDYEELCKITDEILSLFHSDEEIENYIIENISTDDNPFQTIMDFIKWFKSSR